MKENGGSSVSTKTRRKGNVKKFDTFLVNFKKTTLEKVVKDAEETGDITDLENFLISFISAMKVEEKTGDLIAPKANTIKGYKSHIKCHIKKVTKGKIDISNEAIFEQFSVIYIIFCICGYHRVTRLSLYQTLHLHFFFQIFWKGYLLTELKATGRYDTTHHEALLPQSSLKIQQLLALLTKLMQIEDKSGEEYKILKNQLPKKWRHQWHRLLPFGIVYVINMLTGRRANEGHILFTKKTFQKVHDEDTDTFAYEEFVGGVTKNNRLVDQDLRAGGNIPHGYLKSGENVFWSLSLDTFLL